MQIGAQELKLQKLLEEDPALKKRLLDLWPTVEKLEEDEQPEYRSFIKGWEDASPEVWKQKLGNATNYLIARLKNRLNLSAEDAAIMDQLGELELHYVYMPMDVSVTPTYLTGFVSDAVQLLLENGRLARVGYKNRPDWDELQPKLVDDAKALVDYACQQFQKIFPEFIDAHAALREELNEVLDQALRKIKYARQQKKLEQKAESEFKSEQNEARFISSDLQDYIDATTHYTSLEDGRREQALTPNWSPHR